ncbi:MAG: flavodoxin family protein [Ruminococcaceae bacterium]|nr:flavodoxin family protein [Oscillospiraceae bacterium]
MSKKILIISSSIRNKSNSEILAREAEKGAIAAGNEVEFISLKNKELRFCKGCLACQKTMKCVIKDDVAEIMEKVKNADTLLFATPIYYYELCGQLKTLLDRLNPLYPQEYSFRDVYLMTASYETGDEVVEKAVGGINGWIDCFEKARYAGIFNGGGLNDMGEASNKPDVLNAAFEFGKAL